MPKAKKFLDMDANHQALWIMGMVALGVFLCLCPFFLLKGDDGYPYSALPWGWLFGSAIEMVAFLTILKMSNTLFAKQGEHPVTAGLSVLSSALRLLLWTTGLLISAICTFKSEWFGGWRGFNFFTTAAAYLPMLFIVLFTQLHAVKKESASPKTSLSDEKKETK